MLQDGKFEGNNVIGMDPVLGSLSDEGVLTASGTGVTFDRVTTSSNEIKELGKLDDDGIVVDPVERVVGEIFIVEGGCQRKTGEFLVSSSASCT